MYQTNVNNQYNFTVEETTEKILINGKQIDWDMKALPDGTFSIISNGKSYVAILEKWEKDTKSATIRINQNLYNIAISEPIDQLLSKMGLSMAATKKAEPIKAPMPGLVLKILVSPGQEIKKGEPVLILEAMKMENVFKAPADAVVKSIKTEEKKAVEKGEVLIELE